MQIRGEVKQGFPEYIEHLAREVATAAAAGTTADGLERSPYTHLPAIAIDDARTMDVDDAVSAEELPAGGWRVSVHVADPSAHVAAGDALDLEANTRCAHTHAVHACMPAAGAVLIARHVQGAHAVLAVGQGADVPAAAVGWSVRSEHGGASELHHLLGDTLRGRRRAGGGRGCAHRHMCAHDVR
jgi:RNB domain